MASNKQVCRLCLEILHAEDGEHIEETKLTFLLIHTDLSITDNAVACNKCSEQLQHCFDFKASCFYVDNYMAPFVVNHTKLDIKTIFERTSESKADIKLEIMQICRLCMSVIEDHKALNYNTDLLYMSDMIGDCLPEVDLNTVLEPVICELCLSNIKKLNDFMHNCQEVEQRIQKYYRATAHHRIPGEITLCDWMKLKNCDAISTPIKEECLSFDEKILKCPKDEAIAHIECEEVHIKEELDIDGQISGNKEKRFSCPYCDHKCKQSAHLKKHIATIHKIENTANDDKMYLKCHCCPYKCKRMCDLNKHLLAIHGILSASNEVTNNEKKEINCHYCYYKSKYNANIQKHMLAIHGKEMATVHRCLHCPFKSVHARNLNRHLKLHVEGHPYKCPGCNKEYTQKSTLDDHLLSNHDDFHHLITNKINCCKFCTFKSVSPSDFKDHCVNSSCRSTTRKYQCHSCDYFALQKSHLIRHLLVHSNFRPHECTACKKGFNQKTALDSHILYKHKDYADMLKTITHKVRQCTLCSYESIYISHLSRHMKGNH